MIKKLLNRFGYHKIRKRQFAGADTGRLYSSWTTTSSSADSELKNNLRILRARSRELAINNDYAKKFIRMVKTNVIGKAGIILQSKALTENKKPDELARTKIEDAFKKWSKKGVCDITGKYSFRDVQNIVMTSIARDGEVLIRIIRNSDNDFGFSLQLLEADHLDDRYNDTLSNGNHVKMGVEYNKWGKPVGYWIFEKHPGNFFSDYSYSERMRVDAKDMIHLFIPMRISQSRGVPWMHAAMNRLNMVGAYEEAELTAARVAACKGGFYETPEGSDEYVGDGKAANNPIQEAAPGVYEVLPEGWKFQSNDPTHPTTAYKDFLKTLLRGISSGVDVSYNYLASDLENVNYSSLRSGVLDEREVWRDIQAWIAEHFHQVIFEEWLKTALLKQAIRLPQSGYDRWVNVKWQPRGWQWVDPLKDAMTNIKEIEAGTNTASKIAAAKGDDLEENYIELAREKKLREHYGITTNYDLSVLEVIDKIKD
jgi:lambda family phage portal protein